MSAAPLGNDFFKLTELLFSMHRDLSDALVEALEKEGFNDLNYKVIHMIYLLGVFSKKISFNDFRKKANLGNENVHYLLNVGHSKGYINIEVNLADRRATLVSLNENGRKVYEKLKDIFDDEVVEAAHIKKIYDQLKDLRSVFRDYYD